MRSVAVRTRIVYGDAATMPASRAARWIPDANDLTCFASLTTRTEPNDVLIATIGVGHADLEVAAGELPGHFQPSFFMGFQKP